MGLESDGHADSFRGCGDRIWKNLVERVTRLRLSVFPSPRTSHSWSRKDDRRAALSSLHEQRAAANDGTMFGEKREETGREKERGSEDTEGRAGEERWKIVNVCRLFLQHHASTSPSEFPASGYSRPPSPPASSSRPPNPSSHRSGGARIL